MKRHSGVELVGTVLKRGMGYDGIKQADLMEETPNVSIPILMRDGGDYVMARGSDASPAHFAAVYATFERLWNHAPDYMRDTSYHEYHMYVESRAESAIDKDIVIEARRRMRALAFVEPKMPKDFTHGDATLQNCLLYEGRMALIDYSPRPTPSDRVIDQSKLLLSAAGMDNDGSGLQELYDCWNDGWMIVEGRPMIFSSRLQYYVLTHIIRVASRESTYDDFFRNVLKGFFK